MIEFSRGWHDSCGLSVVEQAGRPLILVDGPFGDYEKLVKEGHKSISMSTARCG